MNQSEISNIEVVETISSLDSVEVDSSNMFPGCKGLRAKKIFLPGSRIFQVTGKVVDYRTLRTVQIDTNLHIDPVDEEGNPVPASYLNHSCDPNAYPIVVEDDNSEYPEVYIHALKRIDEGDEVTVDYAFMESEIANPCTCACGAINCRGKIIGFKQLDAQEIETYLSKNIPLSEHLLRLLPAQ